MKKYIFTTVIGIIIVAFIGVFYYKSATANPFKGDKDITIEIKEGETFYAVLNKLKEQNLIIDPSLIKIYMKLNGVTASVVPGTFKIPYNSTIFEFVNILKNESEENLITVTIPEGYNIDEIGELLEEKGLFSKNEFIFGIKSYELPSYIKVDSKRKYELEGFLYPDTYKFKKGSTPQEVIKTMSDRFNKEIESLEVKYGSKVSENLYDIIIMASIVEKEAVAANERPIIASVFNNRRDINMKFQSCATVMYALGEHREKLYEKDLEVDSPYNTYKVDGMPIGPICNPGVASIEAAINPSESNFLYFVSNNDGTHFFTDKYDEFLKVKEKTQGF